MCMHLQYRGYVDVRLHRYVDANKCVLDDMHATRVCARVCGRRKCRP